MNDIDLTVKSPEEIEATHKDEKEQETGIFHWRQQDGSYVPVTEMSKEDIKRAKEFSESRMEKLHDSIKSRHNQMEAWMYRIDKLEEALEVSTEISKEAALNQKELTE